MGMERNVFGFLFAGPMLVITFKSLRRLIIDMKETMRIEPPLSVK